MANYVPENIRNLSLLSHNGAGKTSLAEAILFTAKVVNRLGRVDDGSSTSDYDPAEQKRNISISLSVLPYEWLGKKVNLIDTPGYPDFLDEVPSHTGRSQLRSVISVMDFGQLVPGWLIAIDTFGQIVHISHNEISFQGVGSCC